MFILDIYRFCESRREFTRQDFAKFVYMHRESPRMAKAASVSHRMFASIVSKEFLARSYTNGYLDGKNGVVWCTGPDNREIGFNFRSFEGMDNKYMWEMMHIEQLDDEALFGKAGGRSDNGGSQACLRESDHTRKLLACRAHLAISRHGRDKHG